MVRRLVLYFLVLNIFCFVFAGPPVLEEETVRVIAEGGKTIWDLIEMGYNPQDAGRIIEFYPKYFTPYQQHIAKTVTTGLAAGLTLSKALRVALYTAGYGLAGVLGTYDVIQAYRLISALVELKNIKDAVVQVRTVQSKDKYGIIVNTYDNEYYLVVSILYRGSGSSSSVPFKTYDVWLSELSIVRYGTVENYNSYHGGYFTVTYFKPSDAPAYMSYSSTWYSFRSSFCLEFAKKTMLPLVTPIISSHSYDTPPTGRYQFESAGYRAALAKLSDPSNLAKGSSNPVLPESVYVGILELPNSGTLSDIPDSKIMKANSFAEVVPYFYKKAFKYSSVRKSQEPSVGEVLVEGNSVDSELEKLYPENFNTYKDYLTELESSIGFLKEQVSTMQEQLQNVATKEQYEELLERYKTLYSALESVKTMVETANLPELKEKYDSLVSSYSSLLNKFSLLENSYKDLNNSFSELNSSLVGISDSVSTNSMEIEKIKNTISEINLNLETVKNVSPALESTVTLLQTRLNSLENSLGTDIEDIKNNITNIYKTLTEINNNYETIVNNYNSVDLNPLIVKISEFNSSFDEYKEQMSKSDSPFWVGWFDRLREFFEDMFLPDPKFLGALRSDVTTFVNSFSIGKSPDFEFNITSEPIDININLFGTEYNLTEDIKKIAEPLKPFSNMLITGIFVTFLIRIIKVHFVID